ncbi:hypothetical protein L873DRAFT_1802164 [Choiromyces venosus 120613-1]|uniref:Uncharacterized protein n=1 Tax=Choiromyces venosus 120613-1 TaxID=1336337 RepID=A0A3N4JWE0_9PEZI|nr:hypothetical protein L873DRAFT_1802164 [Choiromyces venosus 120613-1]
MISRFLISTHLMSSGGVLLLFNNPFLGEIADATISVSTPPLSPPLFAGSLRTGMSSQSRRGCPQKPPPHPED